jgi:carbamoyl-phosphate synthase large subunit
VDPDRPVRIDRYLEGVEVDVDAVADGETVLIPGLLEQVERAGVHSGDSVGVFPPQAVSEADQALVVASMERIVRALGVRGLVNAQFIVRDDGVYLIEVNPRASRTVPFMSKVTGVPLVDLAVRIALGQKLRERGWPNGLLPPPGFVAVKAPAFSTTKLRGVDPSLGPFMQSTGEVIGIHADARVATAKALLAASLVPPRAGRGTVPWRSSPSPIGTSTWCRPLRRRSRARATGSRRRPGRVPRCATWAGKRTRSRRSARQPDPARSRSAKLIASGTVRLVVNTPTPRSGPVRDAAEIRLAAIAEGVLCLTAMETAVAAAQALDPDLAGRLSDVRPLDAWVPTPGIPPGWTPDVRARSTSAGAAATNHPA